MNDFTVADKADTTATSEILGNNTFDASGYNVQYALHDNRLNDGDSCTDYEKAGTTFKVCFETAVKNQMLEWFGCLPPWLPEKLLNPKAHACRKESCANLS